MDGTDGLTWDEIKNLITESRKAYYDSKTNPELRKSWDCPIAGAKKKTGQITFRVRTDDEVLSRLISLGDEICRVVPIRDFWRTNPNKPGAADSFVEIQRAFESLRSHFAAIWESRGAEIVKTRSQDPENIMAAIDGWIGWVEAVRAPIDGGDEASRLWTEARAKLLTVSRLGPLADGQKPPRKRGEAIPPDKRTRPMTKSEVARILGRRGNKKRLAEFTTDCIKGGVLKYEEINRQSGFYHIDNFPGKEDKVRP